MALHLLTQSKENFMRQVKIEMPIITKCEVIRCGYNVNSNCHAKAITIGDEVNPSCDTFFLNSIHSRETLRIAGVGACKINSCQYNDDFECTANSISVGEARGKINCLTFSVKS